MNAPQDLMLYLQYHPHFEIQVHMLLRLHLPPSRQFRGKLKML